MNKFINKPRTFSEDRLSLNFRSKAEAGYRLFIYIISRPWLEKARGKYKYLSIMLVFVAANFQSIPLANVSIGANESIAYSDALIARNNILTPNAVKTKKNEQKIANIWITAYSSTPEETDNTPFVTASGNHVRTGVAAANFLPFGSRFKLPEIFNDRVFIVEDRMHERFHDRIDIWFSTKEEAKNFGKKLTRVEIL